MLRNARRSVKPGGLVLLRDHGLCDMVQVGASIEKLDRGKKLGLSVCSTTETDDVQVIDAAAR